jgi:hypothetical protein
VGSRYFQRALIKQKKGAHIWSVTKAFEYSKTKPGNGKETNATEDRTMFKVIETIISE